MPDIVEQLKRKQSYWEDLDLAEMRRILATIPNNSGDENSFFSSGQFALGRLHDLSTGVPVQLHQSIAVYEAGLKKIHEADPARYASMHKGTPFYFLGWLSYELKDYEKGVFYMDSAMAEDSHTDPTGWQGAPAASFLFLDDTNAVAAARSITIEMKQAVEAQLSKFTNDSSQTLSLENLLDKFIKPEANDPTHRSIVTALLTYILEGEERISQLSIRSAHGGSIEPFLTHLFKGGLIFESLLKRKYGSSGRTLRPYLDAAAIDLELAVKKYANIGSKRLDELPLLVTNLSTEAYQERSVAIVYTLRNVTGHDLGWKDVFSQAGLYEDLYQTTVGAILWTIAKLYP